MSDLEFREVTLEEEIEESIRLRRDVYTKKMMNGHEIPDIFDYNGTRYVIGYLIDAATNARTPAITYRMVRFKPDQKESIPAQIDFDEEIMKLYGTNIAQRGGNLVEFSGLAAIKGDNLPKSRLIPSMVDSAFNLAMGGEITDAVIVVCDKHARFYTHRKLFGEAGYKFDEIGYNSSIQRVNGKEGHLLHIARHNANNWVCGNLIHAGINTPQSLASRGHYL